MQDKENPPKEKGFGKYILINELKNKYRKVFNSSESGNPVSNILFLEGIHFNLMYFPLQHLGYKSVVDSIADLYCRNILPENISVNLGVSGRFKREDIEAIIQGISLACERYSIGISAFDLSSSLIGLAISIASYGKIKDELKQEKPEETDLICVTGDLGAAFLGLQLLERERKVFESTGGAQPVLEGFEYVIGRQLKPELRTGLLNQLKEENITWGVMRVIRDGLASELIHIARETGLGCRIYNERLPIGPDTYSAGRELGFEPVIAALNGGDDYEFILTAPVNEYVKIEKMKDLHIIGHLNGQKEGYNLVLPDGSLAELKAQGWSLE